MLTYRLVKLVEKDFIQCEKRIDEIAKLLPQDSFEEIRIGKNSLGSNY
ncbi:hypothetical protein [Cyanobacterium aponinum]|uniref:Uncharacterized protein n=1 Tax=Cyanobacterium aponinum 0216 TaxID=2676140 RepID=A0A844GXL5_9CHRO|nr:hypothetical protein [Cyanobacterium aponinum]MTF40303.1 hypothetical protein [Cyanobacterium aponinum 0216]